MPETIEPMVDAYLDRWRDQFLGIWTRKDLDLKKRSYREY